MAIVDPGTVYLVFAAIILFVIGIVSIFCKDTGNSKMYMIFFGPGICLFECKTFFTVKSVQCYC